MTQKLLSILIAAAFVAMPLSVLPTSAHAKTEKQLRDEHKGKVAKQKSADKKADKKNAKR